MNVFEYLAHVWEDQVDFLHNDFTIESHKNAQIVQETETMTGSVPHGITVLQAVIYANDGKWYPQAPVTLAQPAPVAPGHFAAPGRANWTVPAVFGDGLND